MAFNKNWTQFVVSKGEPFKIEYLDRKFGGRKTTVFEVTEDGVVEVDGVEMTGNQNIAGDVTATGTIQGADLVATDDLTVGDDAAVGGDLAVTGVSTFTGLAKLPAASFQSAVVASGNGAGARTLTGADVGDLVIAVINLTDNADANASFEDVITVADQIQQTATDLTGDQIFVLLAKQS